MRRVGLVIAATWKAKTGCEGEVADVVRDLTRASRLEPGCRFYQAQTSTDEPGTFLIYEIYDDKLAAEAHTGSDHFRRCVLERAAPLLETRHRHTYETIDV